MLLREKGTRESRGLLLLLMKSSGTSLFAKNFEFVVLDLRDDRIYKKFIALIGAVHLILVTEEKEKKKEGKPT